LDSQSISERKTQIIEATVRAIIKFGYYSFSMQDVAKLAGISKGMIHYYFLNKDDLMLGVLKHLVSSMEEDLLKIVSSPKTCEEKLRSCLSYLFSISIERKEYYHISITFWDQIGIKDTTKKTIEDVFIRFSRPVEAILSHGVKDKVFHIESVKDFSQMLVASVDGINRYRVFIQEEQSSSYKQTEFINMIFACIKKK
jgi:TetR/AcrR family transcriptional regulator, fatty acid metabolism regulator protein